MCTGLSDMWLTVSISGPCSSVVRVLAQFIRGPGSEPLLRLDFKNCYSHINTEWCTVYMYLIYRRYLGYFLLNWLFSFRGIHVLDVEGDFLSAAIPVCWICKAIICLYLSAGLPASSQVLGFVSILFPQTRMDTKPIVE